MQSDNTAKGGRLRDDAFQTHHSSSEDVSDKTVKRRDFLQEKGLPQEWQSKII